jgi:hypothetical protein
VATYNFTNTSVTVGTTATQILTATPGQQVTIQNTGTVPVFLGGSTVATSGANLGYSLAASGTMTLPTVSQQGHVLYGIVTTGTAVVVILEGHN